MRITAATTVQSTEQTPHGLIRHGRPPLRLEISLLEPDIFRVTHYPEGKPRLERTWMIVDGAGRLPREGRRRDDYSPFSCPTPAITTTTAGTRISSSQLSCQIAGDGFALSWFDKDGRLFAADQQDRPYPYDRRSRDVYHYLARRPGEHYVGFGEKSGPLDKRGRRLRMFSVDALGYNAETSDPLYKHFPFYITLVPELNIAYGLLYDNLASCTFDMGQEIDNYYEPYRYYHAEDGDIDYFFIYGPTVADVVQKLARLTGTPALPPRWSLGFLMSSWSLSEQRDGQARLEQMVDDFAAHDVPLSSYQISSGYTAYAGSTTAGTDVRADKRYVFHWNRERFPDPPAMSAHFHENGVFLAANIKPAMLTSHPLYDEVAVENGFIRQAEADAPYTALFWGGAGAHLDFTNPFTYGWWRRQVRQKLLAEGIDSTWNDNNEYTLWDDDARCEGFGEEIRVGLIRPLHALLMSQASREEQEAFAAGKRPYVICRSGCIGIQRVAQTWSGDNSTSWHTLRYNIPMGLGMSLSNAGNYGHDVGGLVGPEPGPELLLRWVQSGIFQPRFNFHSWTDDGSYTSPWMHPEVSDLVRRYFRLRYRMIPYWYTLLVGMHRTGAPMIRPLVYEFPHDPRCRTESFDYMAGPNLLVAAVLEEGARERTVYLPRQKEADPGVWIHYFSGAAYAGGQTVTVAAPLTEIPLFVPANGIIPLGDVIDLAQPGLDTHRECRLFPHPQEGQRAFTLIEDDGLTDAYTRGAVTEIQFQVISSAARVLLNISFGQRGYALPYETIDIVLPAGEERPFQTNLPVESDKDGENGRRIVLRTDS